MREFIRNECDFKDYRKIVAELDKKNMKLQNRRERRTLTPAQALSKKLQESFSDDQKKAFELAKSEDNIFITGSAGCGKSYLLKTLTHYLRDVKYKQVAVLAPTATAARLAEGCTIHKFFGFKPECQCDEKRIKTHCTKKIVSTDVIIIDEISMCRIDLFTAVIDSIKKANKKRKELGKDNIRIICFGDFFQLPPVIASEEEKQLMDTFFGFDIKDGYAFKSPRWEDCNFKSYTLTEVMRQKGDKDFIDALNRVRVGDCKDFMWFNDNVTNGKFDKAISIFPYNRQVTAYNDKKLRELEGEEIHYIAELYGDTTKEDIDSSIYDYDFKYKINARVMILANYCENPDFFEPKYSYSLSGDNLFTNGTFGYIRAVEERKGKKAILVETDDGKYIYFYPRSHEIYNYRVLSDGRIQKYVCADFICYDLKLGYSVSIHKSQGQSYDYVNVDPDAWVGAYGMSYVALSRVKSIKGLHLTQFLRPDMIQVSEDVKEFYKNLK